MNPVLPTRMEPRVETDFYATHILSDRYDTVRVRNISKSGMFFIKVPEEFYTNDDRQFIEMALPNQDKVFTVSGRIIRDDVFMGVRGVAILFDKLSRKQAKQIEEFVETFAASPNN